MFNEERKAMTERAEEEADKQASQMDIQNQIPVFFITLLSESIFKPLLTIILFSSTSGTTSHIGLK